MVVFLVFGFQMFARVLTFLVALGRIVVNPFFRLRFLSELAFSLKSLLLTSKPGRVGVVS